MRRWPLVVGAAAGLVLCVGGVIVSQASVGQDLMALRVAARALALGLDPYRNHADPDAGLWDGVAVYQHSRYLYAPLVAQTLRVVSSVPWAVVRALWALAGLGALAFTIWRATRLAPRPQVAGPVTLAVAACLVPVWAHAERGQVDLWLLLMMTPVLLGSSTARAGLILAPVLLMKPAFALVLVPLVATGRLRPVVAAVAGAAALVAVDAVLSGAHVATWLGAVLPRAGQFGEGGPADWLLPDARLQALEAALDAGTVTVDGRAWPVSAIDFPLSASLPRLLAPDGPSAAAFAIPPVLAAATLAWAARRQVGRERTLAPVLCAAAILAVVTSPTGWLMGLVVVAPALPVAVGRGLGRAGLGCLGLGVVALAIPGLGAFAAVAGALGIVAALLLPRGADGQPEAPPA